MSFAELKTRPIRAAAIAAASVSACLLVYASISLAWLRSSDPDDASGFGLRTFRACVGELCEQLSIADMAAIVDAKPAIVKVGWIVSIGAWLGAAALLLSAGLAVFGRFVFRPIAPTTIAVMSCGGTLVAACVFAAVNPARPLYQVGPGFWLGAAGAIGGVLASIFIARQRTPDWDETPPVDEDNW